MAEAARWSLKVSRETDIALRTLLASRGGKKGDLSRFVEDAVNREVLRETVRDIQARNLDADADELERLIGEEVGVVRASRDSTGRH
ncbi:Ribbon-helix-helix domain-containing protein [Sphingobium sp. YR657]|uniref:ribbon-helix-helix domain-containing protein n=1 Tax=Sphingobium sp. YR657 TaxID=1884366 RepID=UPI00091584B7|nr:ribbon-helix-helix domain-containing protein [Sphingobium sp. YR657]SHL51329.1 Ribbon-helix-helix domain-containing protein [Sphingobium sp. YR657]